MNEETEISEVKRSSYYPTFHADGYEYAKIWIVNTLLTILTLGIYSAWAKVRTLKYMYGSVELNNSRFDFNGSAKAILKGRVIAAIFLILYISGGQISPAISSLGVILFFFCAPWIFIKSLQFKLRYTSYRNIPFSFRGEVKEGYKIWFKYATFPFALTALSGIISLILGLDATDPKTFFIIFGVGIVNFLYVIYIVNPALTLFLNFVYKNIYFGKTKTNITANIDEVSKNIIFKYMKISVLGFILTVVLTGVSSMIPFLAPIAIIGIYLYFILIGIYLQFLIIDFVWKNVTLGEDKALTKIEFKEWAIIAIQNIVFMALTFGLYFPWAAVKLKKYKIENRGIKTDHFEKFTSDYNHDDEQALGLELDEAFDIGFEIGL